MKKLLFLLLTVMMGISSLTLSAQNTLTVADGTTTNGNVPIHGLWADAYLRCQTIYPAAMLDAAAVTYGMNGGTISSVTYYMSSPAAEAWTGTWEVKLMEVTATTLSGFLDMTNATTVYTGQLDGTSSPLTITFTTPYTYQGGNLLIEVSETTNGNYKSATFQGVTSTGASWQGYNSSAWTSITGSAQNFVPKTTFTFTGGSEITCRPVQNLTIADAQTTSSSLTLTWTDTLNAGASYTVYNMADNTVVQSGITTTTYTVDNLLANTDYTFGVEANCSATDASSTMTTSGRTACGAISLLPFEEGFETVPSGSYQMPYCWDRYASAYTSAAIYPYSYSSNAHGGSRALYFYGTTGTSYSDTMVAIMPALDVNLYPMNGNRVTFWAKMGAATNSKNVYVGTMTDPADITTFVIVDSVLVSGNTYTLFSAPLTTATPAAPYVAFMVLKGTGTMYIDDVTLEELPACFEVSNVTAGNITPNSVTISWVDAQNTGASYSIYVADSLVGTTTATTYTVTDLAANTDYTFGVEANCPTGDGTVMTVSARTACDVNLLPFTETFDATLANDPCWRGASVLASSVFGGGTLTQGNITGWSYKSAESNGIPAGHYCVNIYGSSCKYWFITPLIDLSTVSSPLLSFDAAFTKYSGTAIADGDLTDDKFMVIISTDGGQTWDSTNAISFNLPSLASLTYIAQYVDLSNYAGDTVKIAFYAESTVSGGDNNLHIDNISIVESTGELCLPVNNLTAGNITENSATLNWVGTADSYNVYVIDNGDTTFVQNVTNDSFDLTGLNAMTSYNYGVCAVCGNTESPMVTINFSTACTAVTLPYTETFEATSGTVSCWTVDGPGSWTVGTGDYSASTGAFEGSKNAKIVHGTTGNVTKFISPALDGAANGMVLDFAYVMRAWSSDVDELRVYAREDADSAWQMVAEYTNAAEAWTVESVIIPGAVYQIAFEFTDNYGYGVGIDSVAFSAMSGDFCFPVTNLTVESTTATSVSLSWTDASNPGATYTIYDMADNTVIAAGVTTTNYEVTGLTSSTGYTFGVVANCSATSASTMATVTALTDCASGNCLITIVGADSFGDGWNGNAINIMQSGIVIGTFTILNGYSGTESFSVCSDGAVTFSWVAGSYPGEASFEIRDGGNTVVYTGAGSSMTAGEFFTLNDACPTCIAPVVTVNDISETSVTISWTGTAASYDVYNGTTLAASVTTNTYTFNNLVTSTTYTFGVQAICSASDSSSVSTVTVTTSCPDVTALPYNEGFEDGLGCWTTINASSDGQPWTVNNCSGLSTVDPHGGAYVASSWSWSGSPMHANAWLISPKFVLPNTTDSISFSWWEITNPNYADSYSVVLSTTTNDTAAFTTVLRPYGPANGTWTMETVDLTQYAGQSVYIAFHHMDYDENYLLIDDIALYQGAYIPPAPDTLTVVFAVNNATMGTTVPAPGSYQYFMGDTVSFHPEANPGYHFTNWVMSVGGQSDTLASNYVSVYFIVNGTFMSYGTVTMTALFEADSTPVTDSLTINLSINNPALGSINPLPGVYHVALNDSLVLSATPNAGVNFDGWKVMIGGQTIATVPFNPFTLPVNQNNITFGEITIVAMFNDGSSAPDSITVIVNTADATMGTTNPAPGTYHYAVGSESFLAAIPNPGYQNLYWIEEFGIAGMVEYDTLYADTVYLTVVPMMAGVTLSITAYFAPGEPCGTPTGLTYGEVTHESIALSWDNADVASWNIRYRVQNGTWTSTTSNTNSYTITGLAPQTTYEIQVQANCGNGNLSDWSGSVAATTTVGIESWLDNSVTLYPNPAKEYVDIRVDGDVNVTSMEVYDVYGKLINSMNVVENPTRINVSNLSNGMYFVRVTTEAGMVTKTFVKK